MKVASLADGTVYFIIEWMDTTFLFLVRRVCGTDAQSELQ
jgi:hypothetical protein